MEAVITLRGNQQSEAHRLYVFGGLSLKTIAERVGVTQKRVSGWAAKEGWKEEKASWLNAEQAVTIDLVGSLKALGEKAREGDIKAITTLLAAQKQLRHQEDPRRLVAEFAAALITLLENEGQSAVADLVAGYLERAAEKVID